MASDTSSLNKERQNVEFLVVDSGAFIKNAPINDIGMNICTVKEVVNEVLDKNTRNRLQVLPYEINFREPSAEAIHAVTEFSKKTGDYRSLSAVDLRLLALTYQLEKENIGDDHIRTEPLKKASWINSRHALGKTSEIAGFYISSKKKNLSNDVSSEIAKENVVVDACIDLAKGPAEFHNNSNELPPANSVENDDACDQEMRFGVLQQGDTLPKELVEEAIEEDDEEEEEEDDDDDEGWITPDNIKSIKQNLAGGKEAANVAVGCLTTDFAMQNVLIQMGLNVISVAGMLIKQARSYVLWCTACLKICTVLTKLFCPCCGNKTLRKISMSVNEDGSVQYNFSSQRMLCHRGTKFSLPPPKGGKHSNNPILVEDQRMPQQRPSKKSLQKMCIFDENYVARTSPFKIHDLTSRAAQLGIWGEAKPWNKRNPNEVGKKFKKKRK